MLGVWDVRDLGCSRCRMWDVGCLQGCGMLIYKMRAIIIYCLAI